MANLTQTPANVAIGSLTQTKIDVFEAGEALTQGMPAYKSSADQLWYKTDANLSAEAAGGVTRPIIVLTPASGANSPFVGAKTGPINVGASLVVGTRYVLSRTAGAICPEADLTTGDYVTSLGVATTSSLLMLDPQVSGVAKP